MATVALLAVPGWWPVLHAVAVPRAIGDADPLVLARARHGDEAAFADVVRHFDRRSRSLAYWHLGDRDRMDDVLRDVYVTAFPSWLRFGGASARGTWLYRITHNACLADLRRRRAIAAAAFDTDRGASKADPRPVPAEFAIERDDRAAALERLPYDPQGAAMPVDAYGLDYAEVLGLRAGTIGSQLSRTRPALRATVGRAAA